MIKKIQIEGLFGRFNYQLKTSFSGVTIITGPNGFGKSTILRIIDAIGKGNPSFFRSLDFESITIEFDNVNKMTIKKRESDLLFDDINVVDLIDIEDMIDRVPWIRRTRNGFFDMKNDEFFSDNEAFFHMYLDSDYSDYYERIAGRKSELKKFQKKIEQIKEWCGEVRFISDQRLIKKKERRRDEPQVIDVISELPTRLKNEITKVSEEYSKIANILDSSYPKRLLSSKEGIQDQREYKEKLEEVNKKFEKLSSYNLVDMSIIDEEKYNASYSNALKIYFDDFAEKYKVFQKLISKHDLFTRIINQRLTFKHIKITRDNGFEVVDNDQPNKVLELSQLSSGEKQEIVLFYELIFDTKEKLLLLIDEPEISLHITWQKKFLDDLLEVAKLIELQVIVATHSPQVVSNHLDIQIDLGELYAEQLNS